MINLLKKLLKHGVPLTFLASACIFFPMQVCAACAIMIFALKSYEFLPEKGGRHESA